MITSETPYKLAEIIRDTWPGLYRPFKLDYNKNNNSKNNWTEKYLKMIRNEK